MIRPSLLAVATTALIAGCVSSAPVGSDGGALYGAASCRASTRGACPEVNGKTLYQRRNADLSYFAPDGFVHTVRGTRVVRERWSVSADGTRLTGRFAVPLAVLPNVYQTIPGDPVGLARRDSVAIRLDGNDTRPFATIAADLRG